MKYSLPQLPYAYNALEPVISEKIMKLHHSKHHQGYVNGANAALEKLEKARKGEVEISVKAVMRDLSFNVNGHVMHELFWSVMRPFKEDNNPEGELKELIEKSFGSVQKFKNEFNEACKSVEGSGWGVLGIDADKNLLVYQLEKHNLLGLNGFSPILANDVWEHAYYLDYKNDRGMYVEKWWNIINWDEVSKRAGL
jgi:Fe-Mn family superoxide dismutase